ncbi:TcpE family conjugal transfer membrane protein [Clostridiisalibacter paucivorans]|uniref:TcpE family conjugal transfer membrane protein n=1 Tax=Clostridiisalibacter paucivorans TaxID=408753 RepID=UPI000688F785|nr:TcpE family conjugal transfer membrane protein [Clostridiisalibacter paucivorans]
MEDNREFEIMRTYTRAWQTEIVMYHLFGIPLWFPVSSRQAAFFMLGLVFMTIFSKVIPLKGIPLVGDPICIYAVYPFLIMKFFTKMTLDGKPPHIFFRDQLSFLFQDKKYNLYKPIKDENKINYSSQIGYRTVRRISEIDYKLLKRRKR